MWSETDLRLLVLILVLHAVFLVLQVLCCVVKYSLITFVIKMILEDTAAFQILVQYLYFVL